MNKAQRSRLQKALDAVTPFCEEDSLNGTEELKTKIEGALGALEFEVESIAEEEREKFDNMSEGLQQTETGQRLEEIADILESVTFPDLSDYDLKTEEGQEAFQSDLTDLIDELEQVL